MKTEIQAVIEAIRDEIDHAERNTGTCMISAEDVKVVLAYVAELEEIAGEMATPGAGVDGTGKCLSLECGYPEWDEVIGDYQHLPTCIYYKAQKVITNQASRTLDMRQLHSKLHSKRQK